MREVKQQGFTLLELTMVVAILGLLAAIAMPSFDSFLGRAQFENALVITDGLKQFVVQFYQNEGVCPDNATNGIPNYGIGKANEYAGQYADSILLEGETLPEGGCIISINFKNSKGVHYGLKNKQVHMRLFGGNEGLYRWTCYTSVETSNYKLLFSSCRYQTHEEALSAFQ